MKALVTGGAGLIGSHIVDLLLEKGYEVRIFDSLEPETHQKKPAWIPQQAEFVHGDMRSKDALAKALAGVDLVFHQAAYGGFAPEVSKYVEVNSLGTAMMFDIIRENKLPIKKIVTASSQGVYGEGKYRCAAHGVKEPPSRPLQQLQQGAWEVACEECGKSMTPLPTDENKRLDPGIIYSLTKYSQEWTTLRIGRMMGIPTVALRYSLTYGPRQSLTNPYTGITSIFSTRILNNLPPIVYEDGHQQRDFVFVEDVAKANLAVMDSSKADGEAFNVGSGKGTTVLEFISVLAAAYGKEATPELPNQFRPGEVRHLFSDNSKLSRTVGFTPSTPLKKGIQRYTEWIGTQGSVTDYFSEALKKLQQRGVVQPVKRGG